MKSKISLLVLLLTGSAHADMLFELGAAPGIEVVEHRTHVAQGVCFAPLGETLVTVAEGTAVPTFRRQHETTATGWAIDISAALRKTSWRGNALFAFYDLGDPGSIEADRYTALYQTSIQKGKEVDAHAHLSPAEGFYAGHSYRMRISQLINGAAVVLAESDLRLE